MVIGTFQLPILPRVEEPVEEQKETGSRRLLTYIQSSPSDHQRKTRRKWSPEPQSQVIQRNPRRINPSHKKSPVWRRIQDLKSLSGLPAAVALSIIGTILAIWKKNIFLFKRTRISILVYIIYTLLYRDLNCHILQIFIICFIQTHSPMESSSVFNLLGMHLSSYLQSGFCRWFLIKTWTQVFVEMKGRIVRLQFLLFYQDFLKRKTTGHCIDVNKYK